MLAHLRAQLPHEGCGLLAGRGERVTHVLAADNIAPHPLVEYEMEPHQQLAHFEFIEAQGLELLGIFHSHPSSPAYPSATDRARAYYPGAVYVIASWLNPAQPEVRAFLLDDERVQEVELVVENGGAGAHQGRRSSR